MKNFTSKKEILFIYFGFILFSFYELFYKKEFGESAMYLGIALAFDPFPADVPWNERKKWQKIILLLQVSLVFLCFLGEILVNQDFKIGFLDGFFRK